MAQLARSAQNDPGTRDLLTALQSEEGAGIPVQRPAAEGVRRAARAVPDDYGHRSHTREMFYPRWVDDPALVIDMVALMASEIGDLEKMEKEKIRERKATEKEVLERLTRLRYGFFKKRVFKIVLKFAQIYLVFRENQRFYLDHMIQRRRAVHGVRTQVRGAGLDRPSDRHLLPDQGGGVPAWEGAADDVKDSIAVRRAEFDRYGNVLPPKFLRGNVEFDDTVVRDANTIGYRGLGQPRECSPAG